MVTTKVSASSRAWKQQINRACAAAGPTLPPGPVALTIEFTVSPARNWATLWKPAIDALGPLLGVRDFVRRPYTPNDDQIVDLGLHRVVDPTVGWDVGLTYWWAPTD